MPHIFCQGLKINYSVSDTGSNLLVLHGWGGSYNSWLQFRKLMVNKGISVIIPDLPGFGKSDKFSKVWTLDDYIDFVLEFTNKLGLEKFYLLGHSFGGRLAIKLAAKYPKKVKKLILVGSAGVKAEQTLKQQAFFILVKIGKFIFSAPGLKWLQPLIIKLLTYLGVAKDYYKLDGTMRETFKNVINEDLFPYLSKIKAETLIIWGKGDRIVPLEYGRLIKKEISRSRLEIIDNARHGVHLQTPEKLVNLVCDFIK